MARMEILPSLATLGMKKVLWMRWGCLKSEWAFLAIMVMQVGDMKVYRTGCSNKCIIWCYDIYGFEVRDLHNLWLQIRYLWLSGRAYSSAVWSASRLWLHGHPAGLLPWRVEGEWEWLCHSYSWSVGCWWWGPCMLADWAVWLVWPETGWVGGDHPPLCTVTRCRGVWLCGDMLGWVHGHEALCIWRV